MAEENVPLALLPTVATAVDTAMNLSPASRNETGLRDEIKHTTAQRSVRMVLWHSDDEPPLMRMVPVDAYNNITAANLEWVVDACGGSVALWCEVWKIVDAGWRVHILNDEKLAVEDTRVAVLVRGGGVERCVNIGVELELLSQFLSKDVESSLSRSLRRNHPACGPGALVYIWTKDGDEPAVFNIPLESDGTVIITTCAAASALWADPEDPQDDLTRINVAMWDSEQTEWCLRRLGERFAVVAAHRTLLIKKSDTTNTVGFGDVLARLDKALRDNALESREKVGSFSPAKNMIQCRNYRNILRPAPTTRQETSGVEKSMFRSSTARLATVQCVLSDEDLESVDDTGDELPAVSESVHATGARRNGSSIVEGTRERVWACWLDAEV
ncbi:hypothetical protein TRAPUB_6128 [Trametes pubescens]|uniref:Uncharacterized protein n=1 Tax=Trametes pubescens TaxID=154538 RepID=A0A1M2V6P9_TRAPU|nr:hypothetical protein TRAPUB_6128 [Trametes pubescens]